MISGNLFCLQIASSFANRRTTILRIGVTALLAIPFIFVAMPLKAKTSGIVMVIMFTAFFGSAVGYTRLRDDSRLERLILLPTSRVTFWLDMVLSSLLTRIVPAIVVSTSFVAVNGQSVTTASFINMIAMLCGSLVLLTLLGIAIGSLARNNAEVHLFGALTCAILAFVSGLTPLPERLAWLTATKLINPIAHLLLELNATATVSSIASQAKLVISLLILTVVTGLVIVRWIAGFYPETKGFDNNKVEVDNKLQ
jgi:hypothetical protein